MTTTSAAITTATAATTNQRTHKSGAGAAKAAPAAFGLSGESTLRDAETELRNGVTLAVL